MHERHVTGKRLGQLLFLSTIYLESEAVYLSFLVPRARITLYFHILSSGSCYTLVLRYRIRNEDYNVRLLLPDGSILLYLELILNVKSFINLFLLLSFYS